MVLLDRMVKNTFNRDIIILLLVSIVIGSLMAGTVSLGANAYFSKTLSSLVGDYGEYDIVIQVREEMKTDAVAQIQKVMNEVFPGSKMKEGPTVTGKANIFIAIPDQYKTAKTYEDLDKTFGSIPGGASVGVMTEPRITVRGVPDGAKPMVLDAISQMDGVRFVFRDGASIGVILSSTDKTAAVNTEISNLLKQYQVVEISFPVGSEPANPIRMGQTIADSLQTQLKLDYVQNVSVDGQNDDMTYMVSTMMELKRFLSAYASKIVVTPAGGAHLIAGDSLVFQGTAANPPAAGAAVDKGNVVVQVTAVRTDGSAEGMITQGDAALLTNNQAYKLDNSVVGAAVGMAVAQNPRQELSGALNETSKIVGQIPGMVQDGQSMSGIAMNALDNYDASVAAMRDTLNAVQGAGTAVQSAAGALAAIDTASLQNQLDASSRAVGGMANTLQVLKIVSSDVGGTISSLNSTQQNLDSLKNGLQALGSISEDARQAKSAIDSIAANGNQTLAQLQAFDAEGAKNNLTQINGHLGELQAINVPLVTAQLQYMAAAAPNLKDEEISHSIALLDKFIAGQVIPGQRIQILTKSSVTAAAATPIIQQETGNANVSIYTSAIGVIEPNTRSEVYSVLKQVKAILAAMTSIIVTILFLVLDHTAVMTVIRRRRQTGRAFAKGWRGALQRFKARLTAPDRHYGMAVGAIMLTSMFILAGGGIPYLPWAAVPVLGAFLGWIVAGNAEKISPISPEEMMAGEALGLSFDEIMREIVVPSSRPGLLQKLNQRQLKFR